MVEETEGVIMSSNRSKDDVDNQEDNSLKDIDLSISMGKQIVLNYMKCFSLRNMDYYLNSTNQKDITTAHEIMEIIIDGYQAEKHSVQ